MDIFEICKKTYKKKHVFVQTKRLYWCRIGYDRMALDKTVQKTEKYISRSEKECWMIGQKKQRHDRKKTLIK